jgi:Zn2+/Cd2+-exporting ATPase
MSQLTGFSLPDRRLLEKHPETLAALCCGLLVLLGGTSLHLGWLSLSLLLLSGAYVSGGYVSAREGLETLLREKELDVDLLMIVAALGAAGLGLWQQEYTFVLDGAVLILIFAVSGALETYAMQRTERNIRGLMSLTPDSARRLHQGQEQPTAVAELRIGDRVLVKPGELIPVDGLILEGSSTLNQAPITGESMPVEKSVGEEVFAGSINGNGALQLRVHKPPASSLIQRIIRLVEQAQTEAPPSQQFVERFERGYAQVIVGAGILLALLPPFLWQWTWETTIYRALIFLVVASPCALMAAIMPALLSGIANGARQGILFKSGAHLETLGQVRAIAFDKTGTLTTGKPQVVAVISGQEGGDSARSQQQILQLAASLETVSEHPLGQAIVQAAQHQGLHASAATQVQAQPGLGITGTVAGQAVMLGRPAFVQSQVPQDCPLLQQQSDSLEQEGKTVVWVAQGGKLLGLIAIADQVRPEAGRVVSQLKQLGIQEIVMVTGDNPQTANTVAQALGIDRVYAGLLPEEKVATLQQLRRRYQTVAMVGDGINDAPALAQASVGIAMGAAGSDVALETADVVLMANRLEKLVAAIRLGRRSQRIVKQNIGFALGFIVLLLVATFAADLTLPLGVIGHEGSTVLVTLSGLRLLKN